MVRFGARRMEEEKFEPWCDFGATLASRIPVPMVGRAS